MIKDIIKAASEDELSTLNIVENTKVCNDSDFESLLMENEISEGDVFLKITLGGFDGDYQPVDCEYGDYLYTQQLINDETGEKTYIPVYAVNNGVGMDWGYDFSQETKCLDELVPLYVSSKSRNVVKMGEQEVEIIKSRLKNACQYKSCTECKEEQRALYEFCRKCFEVNPCNFEIKK